MRTSIIVAAALVAPCAAGAAGGAAPRPPVCAISQLRVAPGPEVSEKTGQHTFALRLTNGGRTCSLDGYPAVWLEDAAGTIPFAIRHGGDQMLTSRPPALVVVGHGGVAFVLLNHYRCDLGDIRSATTVRIGLPGARRTASVSLAIRSPYRRVAWCGRSDPGSTLSVSPFEPTLRAAFRQR